MSYCSWRQLTQEWANSVKALSDILGTQVTIASVPGGYYSTRVAKAASAAGITTLFNSEPVTRSHEVDGCLVLGRYTILGGMLPSVAAGIAAGHVMPRVKQLMFWKLKELGKRAGGESYLKVRKVFIQYASRARRRAESAVPFVSK